jgi:ERCC4-type nuclease
MKKIIPITIDTREQTPFLFEAYPCITTVGTLHTGDYGITGFETAFVIELKSLSDLAGCMMDGRERFERELERMREYASACVIVEEPLNNVRNGAYRSKLNPASFEQSILALSLRYRVPFFFGHNRDHAEYLAFNCIRHIWNKTADPKQKVGYVEYIRK